MPAEVPHPIRRARQKWRYTGEGRPEFAHEPGPSQESVWDYPRPPRLERDGRRVQVIANGITVGETDAALRVLETASPPTFYLPPGDLRMEHLVPSSGRSMCEWKGPAHYWSVRVGDVYIADAAWSYPDPFPGFEPIAGYLSFYPAKLECYVDGVRARPQPGDFYGGWITPELVGPFKGEAGSGWW